MKLHWSPLSPFVRKVMIVLNETEQLQQVECVRSVVAASQPPNPDVMADNPLNKIPTLVTNDGLALCDSRVICEYLDLRAGTGLFPTNPERLIQQLRWQALADGMTDILLLWRTELTRKEGPWAALTNGWLEKIRGTMALFDNEAAALAKAPNFGIGHIALISTLGHLDFRWPDCGWRDHFPALAALENDLSKRPSVKAAPRPDTDVGNGETAGHLIFAT